MYRTHEMRMIRTEESGLEEWACPTCGRRMLLRWPPDYHKQIIEPGDEKACHVCSSPGDTGDTSGTSPAGAHDEARHDEARHDGPRDGTTSRDTAAPGPGPAADPSERRCRNARRWLRETGVDAVPPTTPLDRNRPEAV